MVMEKHSYGGDVVGIRKAIVEKTTWHLKNSEICSELTHTLPLLTTASRAPR